MTDHRTLMISSATTAALGTARISRAATGKGTLTVRILADPALFGPHLTSGIQAHCATRAIHDALGLT